MVPQTEDEEETSSQLTAVAPPTLRRFGRLNWRGLWTLGSKEVHRFLKIPAQTIISPLVMTLLFYAIFAMGFHSGTKIGGIHFLQFIIPGLVMMSMAQSAYVNTSASLILSKIQGNMVDVLMSPLSPLELTIGYAFGGLVRGLLVGLFSLGVLTFFTTLPVQHGAFIIYFGVMGSLMLSLAGVITGIWGDKFDHMGGVQNFIIMPATFLSGTFFSLQSLPEKWQFVCTINPFFYMIDGFRYGFTGIADSNIWAGMGFLMIVNLVLFTISYWMFAHGSYLKK